MIQRGYFILTTTVSLGMGITYSKLLFCHGISEGIVDKNISTREYNNSKVYDCFNNPFRDCCCRPGLNLPTTTIYGRPRLDKIAGYTLDLITDTMSFVSKTLLVILPPLLIRHNSFS